MDMDSSLLVGRGEFDLLDLFEEPPITFITEESKFVALKPLVEDVFGALTTGVVTYGDKE